MVETAAAAPAAGIAWDALEARLASALSGSVSDGSAPPLPPYRRPWFVSLIRQGREAEATGRAALAAHCRDRLDREFAHFGIADSAPPETSTAADERAGRGSVPAAGDAPRGENRPGASAAPADSGDPSGAEPREPRTASPAGARASTLTRERTGASSSGKPAAAPRPPSPLEALAMRRDAAARARLRELLARHAARLSPDEVAGFLQALEATGTGAAPGVSSGAAVAGLRRRLLDRLMRAARYRRQASRLAAWNPAPPTGVAGPYNGYRALEDLLHRVTRAHPLAAAWAAEYFDIYAEMKAIQDAYNTVLPETRK